MGRKKATKIYRIHSTKPAGGDMDITYGENRSFDYFL